MQKLHKRIVIRKHEASDAAWAWIEQRQARQESQIEPADLPTGPQYWLIPDQYEITYSDQMDTTTNAPNTIVIREKEPWQPPGGGWLRTHGFADGHIEDSQGWPTWL